MLVFTIVPAQFCSNGSRAVQTLTLATFSLALGVVKIGRGSSTNITTFYRFL